MKRDLLKCINDKASNKVLALAICMAAIMPASSQAAVKEISISSSTHLSTFYNNGTTNTFDNGGVGAVFGGGYTRLYEKFILPAYDPSLTLTSGLLWTPTTGRSMEVYLTDGNWVSFNYYTAPKAIGGLVAKTATDKKQNKPIDLTEYLNKAYKNGTPVGFMMKSAIEGQNWTDATIFPSGAQKLSLTFTSAVPEPETYAMLLTGLGMMGFIIRRRRKA